MQGDAELRRDAGLQIAPPPARQPVLLRVRASLDPSREHRHLVLGQPPGALHNSWVLQPGQTLAIVAVPVRRGNCPPDTFLILLTPQRLAVHAAGRGRRFAAPPPSSASASASIRRAARTSRVLPAAARNSVAVNACRVTAIPAMPTSLL